MFAALNSFLTRAVSGYFLNKSLRFRSSASAYLNRTPATATNQTTWTWSGWVKRGTLGQTYRNLFGVTGGVNDATFAAIYFGANGIADTLGFQGYSSVYRATTAVYRDPAAWYHIVVAVDTTQATAANRVLMYVNGDQITSFATSVNPSPQSVALPINSTSDHQIGRDLTNGGYFDGELAEVNFVDGQALLPASFGAYSTYNQWLPIRYAGTYGTNGFYLPFNSVSTSSYAGSFNGSNQYLSMPLNAVLTLGSGNFTVEAWIIKSTSGSGEVFGKTGTVNYAIDCATLPGNNLGITLSSDGLTATTISGATTLATNRWYHAAWVRSGTTVNIYLNGVLDGTGTFSGAIYSGSNVDVSGIGARPGSGITPDTFFNGYISNLRVVKGTAVYTAAFTPPVASLTAITNTSLLTLQSATIVDNSGNSVSITNNNTVVTSVQYPFTLAIAADSSGNANNWTPNNISLTAGSTYDSLTDVPTLTSETVANYAVLNAVNPKGNSTVSNGNLTEVITTVTGAGRGTTIAVTSGKFYVEATAVGGGAMVTSVGITSPSASTYQVYLAGVGYYSNNGNKYISGVGSAYGTAWASAGTYTIGMALDVGAGTIQFYLNNVAQGNITLPTMPSDGWIFVADWESGAGSVTYNWNFGQQPFTYTAPSGFLPLNTFNI